MKSAVQSAVTTNPAIRAASDEYRASAFDLLKQRADFEPTVSLFAEAGAQRLNDPQSLSAADNNTTRFTREVGINAEYVLFDGARRANLVYANSAQVDGNIFRLLDASETMALNATEVYIDVYRHLLLLDAAKKNLARHREIGSKVFDLVSGGKLPRSDQFQAQDRIRASELLIIDIERQLRDAEARYLRVVGHRRQGKMAVPSPRLEIGNRDVLMETAVRNSFRVKFANTEIGRADYERIAAESDLKPRVTFNAGVRHGTNIDGVQGSETDTFIGLRMNWILHQGGRNERHRANIERRNKAISERHVLIGEVRELAERAWNNHQSNVDRSVLLDVQLSVNRRLVAQYMTEFDAGTRSMLELLDAERATFEVLFAKINADASLAFGRYRLLAVQSKLANHFGVRPADTVLSPNFEARARANTTSVFKTAIPALDRTDDR